MKKSDIKTLDDLKEFLTEYCEKNPEDDCCGLVREICEDSTYWLYTDDSDDIEYDDEDYVTDGDKILSYTSEGWEVCDNDGQDIEYDGRTITVREDREDFYVNFNAGLGDGVYPKSDWTLKKAIEDQANIFKENR